MFKLFENISRAFETSFGGGGGLHEHFLSLRWFNKQNRCGNKDLDDILGLFC
jgi:hypothetical protein